MSSPSSLNTFKPRVFVVEQLATLDGSGQIAHSAVASGGFVSLGHIASTLPFDTKQLPETEQELIADVAVGDTRITPLNFGLSRINLSQ